MKCDISNIRLKCPGKRKLALSFEEDLGEETGSESFGWKLNPVDLRAVKKDRARLGAGSRALEVIPLVGDNFQLERETVPFAPSGLAAGSLKSFVKGSQHENDRLLVRSTGDVLVLAIAGKKSNISTQSREGGFSLRSGNEVHEFDVNMGGRGVLTKA